MPARDPMPTPTPPIPPHTDVCVAEDEPAVADVICDIMKDAELHPRACPLGWEAHRCIRTNQPKVVILDVLMPIVDGITLFYTLRADPATQHIPVIFLTANAWRVFGEIPNYRELGADLIEKPFDTIELLERVAQAMDE
jgi:DNA-binding response OmpR family regulator